VTDGIRDVALPHEASDGEPTSVLPGGAEIDPQFLGSLREGHLRTLLEEDHDLDAPVIRRSFDNPFELTRLQHACHASTNGALFQCS